LPSLGEQFRAAREARGVTLSEAAERIHIRSIYLQAIEEEDWPSIGAAVYVRGFLRTYARFLGLDPEGSVAQFNDLTGIHPSHVPVAAETASAAARSGPSVWVWLGAIVAVALLGIVGYSFWQLESPGGGKAAAPASGSPAPASSPLPTPAAPASPAEASTPVAQASSPGPSPLPLPPGVESVTLAWTAPSWVRVVVDGKVATEGTFAASTVRTYQGRSISVRLGNAGGVDVKENGRDLGALGRTGDVVERIFPTGSAN